MRKCASSTPDAASWTPWPARPAISNAPSAHATAIASTNTSDLNVQQGLRSLSWTGSGVLIPCEEKAADVFTRMFLQGTKAETDAQVRKLDTGRSILDAVAGQARDLQRAVGPRDRDRLDQYFRSECAARVAQPFLDRFGRADSL